MRSTTSSSSTTTRANGTQACAACKYQRRKCYPDCILAPYFPHDRQSQFLNAHKLFGVSNITKIIRNLTPPEKDEAMRTIIFQSDVRAADPVGGCCRIIRDLQRQIKLGHLELDLILHQLALCRAAAAQQASLPNSEVENLSGYDGAISYENMALPLTIEREEEDNEEFFLQENNSFQEIAAWAMQDTASSCIQEKQQGFLKVDCGDDEDFEPNLLDIADEKVKVQAFKLT
ncbi:LOB domain-containing protein 22 [Diospyros lotus]|uniref:LOB domain-containing protein 22 n=1 Tax=Diospyros lotus TaxID=55363 RepID=UPI00225C3810|nr:LOB domain-containing protein 22 [Diospyros lotus]